MSDELKPITKAYQTWSRLAQCIHAVLQMLQMLYLLDIHSMMSAQSGLEASDGAIVRDMRDTAGPPPDC